MRRAADDSGDLVGITEAGAPTKRPQAVERLRRSPLRLIN
jgi:hypothetical protein